MFIGQVFGAECMEQLILPLYYVSRQLDATFAQIHARFPGVIFVILEYLNASNTTGFPTKAFFKIVVHAVRMLHPSDSVNPLRHLDVKITTV